MKKILVPVDFTNVSENAAFYAAEMAKAIQAELILFHAYSYPVAPLNVSYEFTTDIPYIVSQEQVENDCLTNLNVLKDKIVFNHGTDFDIVCMCKSGWFTDEINVFAKEGSVDLIIMGIEETGALSEKLFGSTTTTVVSQSECPVLVIHEDTKYEKIERIAVACDFNEVKNEKFFTSLRFFANLFDPYIHLVNVIQNDTEPLKEQQMVERLNLDRNLLDLKHSFAYIKNNDVTEGINSFVESNNIDLLVMVPRTHSVFYRMFNEPTTKRMAFHTIKPLLTIHE